MSLWILPLITILSASPDSTHAGEYKFAETPSWSDEFDYNGLPDARKWGYDVGSLHNGWGNHELQYYTAANRKNASVANGVLRITAIKEQYEGLDYTSARLVSKNKGDFLYGRFVVRAKVPKGKGTWAAAWMLPTDWVYGGWPHSGEIDIMEHVGYDENAIHITVHTKDYNHSIGTQKGVMKRINQATSEFHDYRIDWTPEYIRGFVDDVQIYSFPNEGKGNGVWPFDKRFHLLLNLAVGGDWGGVQGVDSSAFPAEMEVDYVRVYDLLKP
ncbi:glycoside hydrolase family 16 protein [Sphingobacterium siyangense]|uniref:glycoside hydrolase family 16 protein n=2 Tax=Sphingobacterium TaxID=28453 RepID=UPI00200BB826|nr:glycoside hydrolase family 16 protein [Sphingobacterium siyangense]UQA74303.1 glycoside hydrolase family 16 protein [Sphingobacterium siyangense]